MNDENFRPSPELSRLLDDVARRTGLDEAGLALVMNEEGLMAHRHGERLFTAASLIKVPVLAALHTAYEEGRHHAADLLEVTMVDYTDTWKPVLKVGDQVSLRDLACLMIRTSDNVATNMLLGLLGPEAVETWLRREGLGGIHVRRKLGGTVVMPGQPAAGNQIHALGMATLFHRLSRGRLVSPREDAAMRAILRGQEDGTRFRSGLETADVLEHKTGETSRTCHDAGLLVDEDGTTTLVALQAAAPLAVHTRRLGAFAAAVRDHVRAERRRGPDRVQAAATQAQAAPVLQEEARSADARHPKHPWP
ncbi:MAG: serine hydrolase [Candidatus Sericytochromatia bacterium]|nr:serine hydrolase [Candidatus Sericytochromatia bacterium]